MNINTNTLVSISEANQNFSKVARLVDEYGSAVILKNNTPKYVVLEFSKVSELDNHNMSSIPEFLKNSKKNNAVNKNQTF